MKTLILLLWLASLTCVVFAADEDAATKSKLTAGDAAPDFALPSTGGGQASLADYKGKWLVICFYIKSFTPPAEKEFTNLREGYASIQKMGADVVGISRDDLATLTKFAAEQKLPFALLSDADKTVAKNYDVLGFGGMVQRRSLLIDPKGKVAHIFYGVTTTKHTEEIVDALRKYQAEAKE